MVASIGRVVVVLMRKLVVGVASVDDVVVFDVADNDVWGNLAALRRSTKQAKKETTRRNLRSSSYFEPTSIFVAWHRAHDASSGA